jgi:hypothetical protein
MRILLSCLVVLLANAPYAMALAQTRFQPSAEGLEVTDKRSGLVWRRCAEGQQFKANVCKGEPLFLSYPATVSHTNNEAKRTATAWRLPTMKELSAIAAASQADVAGGIAAIDAAAFPGTPVARYWTATSVGPHYFMYVSFSDASVGEARRNAPGAVRLVRAAQ